MQVSLRSFQLKPTAYLNKLPIELTRYGKVIAVLNPHVLTDDKDVLTHDKSKPTKVLTDNKKVLTDKPSSKPATTADQYWCFEHDKFKSHCSGQPHFAS